MSKQKKGERGRDKKPEKMKEPNNQEGERERAKESLGQKGSDSFLAHFLLAHFHFAGCS